MGMQFLHVRTDLSSFQIRKANLAATIAFDVTPIGNCRTVALTPL